MHVHIHTHVPKSPLLVLSSVYISVLKSACVDGEILLPFDLRLFTGPCCAITSLLNQIEQSNYKASVASPMGRFALFTQ